MNKKTTKKIKAKFAETVAYEAAEYIETYSDYVLGEAERAELAKAVRLILAGKQIQEEK